jgi:electron transfer flavoprotein beta subunit
VTNVLVCIKRVPDSAGEVLLTDDAMRVDARYVGYTVSPHEECAVELAIQLANQTGGAATVLTLGSEDAVEQLRDALAVGCTSAVRIDADADAYGPADVAAAIADVVETHESAGTAYDLVLLGNDAADTGDFQVGVRLAYALERPVVTGISTVDVTGGVAVARGDGPAGSPRYPSIPGRMKAKRAPVETVAAQREPVGGGRVRLTLPATQPSQVEILGTGPAAAPAVVDLLLELGVVSR